MSNIGYAVFGSPKGIAVISNGIFKELNLDKSLYLNNSQIILAPKEQVLLIRRIPSNLKNLDKKNGLLIVLYEYALQHSENRSGGFVGSAICFKDKMPNAEKMISGLLYLFKKIKENVDENNRFKSIDSSSWNISLPDSNKEFGMFEKNNLNYAPFSNSKVNYAIKINNFERESVALLTSVCLNYAYHNANYIYASNSNNVINKLIQSGLINLEYSSLFNYSKHLAHFSSKIEMDKAKLTNLKNDFLSFEKRKNTEIIELKRLEDKLINKSKEINSLDKEIQELEKTRDNIKKEKDKEKRNLNEIKKLVVKKTPQNSLEKNKEITEYRRVFNRIITIIKKHTNIKIEEVPGVDMDKQNKYNVEHYFEKLPKRKKKGKIRKMIFLLFFIIGFFTVLGLLFYKNNKLVVSENKFKVLEKTQNKSITQNKKQKLEQQFFNKILKNNKNNKNANQKEFKTVAKTLLNNFLNNKYTKETEEFKFVTNYNWEFWEFDYTNKNLIKELNLNDQNYFIDFDKVLKPNKEIELNLKIKWKNLDYNFEKYLNENNDLYHFIDPKYIKDTVLLKRHFKWLVEKHNGEIKDLKKKENISLPFIK